MPTAERIGTPEWNAAMAGLLVLRLVDAARVDISVVGADWTGLRAVMDNVNALRDGTPFRRPLTKVIDELRNPGSTLSAVNTHLVAFGRALDIHGHRRLPQTFSAW